MAVLAADLIAPTGRLKSSYFPADDGAAFTARIAAYLVAANARATADGIGTGALDQAVTLAVYEVGFADAYTERLDRPSTGTLADEGTGSWSAAQLQGWLTQSQDFGRQYAELVMAANATTGVAHGYRSIRSYR